MNFTEFKQMVNDKLFEARVALSEPTAKVGDACKIYAEIAVAAAPVIIVGATKAYKLLGKAERVADKAVNLKRRHEIYDPSGRCYVKANKRQMKEFNYRRQNGEKPSAIIRDMKLG